MSISESDVRHIAALARVGVDESRIPTLVAELNGILAHMDVLQRVELSPAAADGTSEQGMPLAADVLGAVPLLRERATFAPAMRDGFFLVPRLATHDAAGASEDE